MSSPPQSPALNSSEPVVVSHQSPDVGSQPLPPISFNADPSSTQPASDDKIPPLQSPNGPNFTTNGATNNGWASSSNTWGVGLDFELTEREWSKHAGAQVSMTNKSGGWGDDNYRFTWRLSSGSDHHVTHFTQADLLLPTSPNTTLFLDNIPNEKWARIQLLKSL
ncbi:hypothetical protein AAF712_007411 [Marasmius tenuissimus]|uniref:Uncharacterized protein n=1 Tax=Marasmius tenuissimus TaxID=585030 RepID=A0ABR2ZW48_9AGAR